MTCTANEINFQGYKLLVFFNISLIVIERPFGFYVSGEDFPGNQMRIR